jgi:prevent-host-death family protein
MGKEKEIAGLPIVSVRELGNAPGAIVERARKGERLIVSKHGLPVATIQPLTGFVLQPGGPAHDAHGNTLADIAAEIDRLSIAERAVLISTWNGVIKSRPPAGLLRSGVFDDALKSLIVKGAIKELRPGRGLTGLGRFLADEVEARFGDQLRSMANEGLDPFDATRRWKGRQPLVAGGAADQDLDVVDQ